jgi:hypothetical protein
MDQTDYLTEEVPVHPGHPDTLKSDAPQCLSARIGTDKSQIATWQPRVKTKTRITI